MADIVQEIGFETSQAVASLNALNAALKGVNTRMLTFNKRVASTQAANMQKSLDGIASSANKAQQNLGDANQAMKKTEQGAQKVTVAFSGLAKALVAREAVQLLNRIKTAILESADAAAEFEIAIARISNIAKGPGSTIDQLSESLSNLSIELGRPAEEVNEAAWEALQNDLGTTRETMELMKGAAGDLALITGGTLTQSINALSSVLKAYDMDISEAANVTDIFFAAIDKGRITLEELESSLGKITPLAARLDIDFENVAAAMAAITQQGTTAAVANTQLRSIFQKLIRPTEELQKAFNKLGVNTFNELISRSGNLQVALEQIAGALGNNDAAIAKAFGRLRGQLGVFNLLANEGKIFTDTLEAVSEAAGSAAEAAANIRDTDAFQARVQAEEFNKTLREIGETVLQVKTQLIAFANDWLPSGKSIADVLQTILQFALALGGAAVIGSLTTFGGSLAAALAPLAPFLAAGVIGFAIGEAIDALFQTTSEKLDAIAEKVKNTEEAIAKSSEDALKQSNLEIERLYNQRGEAADKYVSGLSAAFEKETQVIRNAAKQADDLLSANISDFQTGLDKVFDSIESQMKRVEADLDRARGRAYDARQALEDFQFDKGGRNLSAAQNFDRALSRAKETGRDLARELSKAKTDPQAAETADKLADRLQDQAQALRQQASQTDNVVKKREAIAEADRLEEKALKAKVALADREVSALTRKEQVTESIYNKNKLIKEELNTQLELLKEQLSILDEQGKIKTPTQMQEDRKGAEQTFENIRDLGGEFSAGLFDTFGETKNLDKLANALDRGLAQAQVDWTNVLTQLEAKLQQKEFKIFVDLELDTTGLDEAVAQRVEAAAERGGVNPVQRYEEQRKEIAEMLKEDASVRQELKDAMFKFMTADEAMVESLRVAIQKRGFSDVAAMKSVLESFDAMRAKLQDPALTGEQVGVIESQIMNLKSTIDGLFATDQITGNVADAFTQALENAQKAVDAKKIQVSIEPVIPDAALGTMKDQVAGIKVEAQPFLDVETAVKNTATSAQSAATGTGNMKSKIEGSIGPATRLANELERAAAAAAAAAAAQSQAMMYFAEGGTVRGADTQPAMLAKDEFVVNARSSRQFFSQLQAINSGQTPIYREEGGSVTNFGDINVNVTGGAGSESPDRLGQQIANSLRRELRRKTSAL